MQKPASSTSWNSVSSWYNKVVGSAGHYYHEHIVIPGAVRLLALQAGDSLLDLGCGQGVLARSIPPTSKYLGIDAAPDLIQSAKKLSTNKHHSFTVANVSKPLSSIDQRFSHAAFILSLQNMSEAAVAIKNAAQHLENTGKLLLVLNHPSFRIPRQSGWGVDEKTKQQYRWVTRYLSPLKVPIQMSPGKNAANVTWSFHHSLQDYARMLSQAGFVITALEEWSSDKQSQGKAAKMENRARSEFPLFLAILATKAVPSTRTDR